MAQSVLGAHCMRGRAPGTQLRAGCLSTLLPHLPALQRNNWCCGVCQAPKCDASVSQRALETILGMVGGSRQAAGGRGAALAGIAAGRRGSAPADRPSQQWPSAMRHIYITFHRRAQRSMRPPSCPPRAALPALQGYPLGDLQPSELFGRIRGRTLWMVGDSITWGFYQVCPSFCHSFCPSCCGG